MAIQSFQLDPNAQSYTDNEIVDKVNAASNNITRAGSVTSTARPLAANEVGTAQIADDAVTAAKATGLDNTSLAAGAAAANLDAMSDTARGYVKTQPSTGQFPVVAVQRSSTGELEVDYDDVAL